MRKVLCRIISIASCLNGWTNSFVLLLLLKLSSNHSVRQGRHKRCVESIQTGGFVTLIVINLSGKYASQIRVTSSSASDEVLARLMHRPRNSKVVVGSTLDTLYKFQSFSGRVMSLGREPLFHTPSHYHFRTKKNTRSHLLLVGAMSPPVAQIQPHYLIIRACIF